MSTLQEAQAKLTALLDTPISVAEIKLEGDEPNTQLVPKKVEKTVRELSDAFEKHLFVEGDYVRFNTDVLLHKRKVAASPDEEGAVKFRVGKLVEVVFPNLSNDVLQQNACDAINSVLGAHLNPPLTVQDIGHIEQSKTRLIAAIGAQEVGDQDKLEVFLDAIQRVNPPLPDNNPLKTYKSQHSFVFFAPQAMEKQAAALKEFNAVVQKIENSTFNAEQDTIVFYKGIAALEYISGSLNDHLEYCVEPGFGEFQFQIDSLYQALQKTVTSDADKEALLQAVKGVIVEIDSNLKQWGSKTASQELANYSPNPLDNHNFISDSGALWQLVSVVSGCQGYFVNEFLKRVKKDLPEEHPLQSYECPPYMPHIISLDTPVDIGKADEQRFVLERVESHNVRAIDKILEGFLEVGKSLGLKTDIREIEHEVTLDERKTTAALGSVVSADQVKKVDEPQL